MTFLHKQSNILKKAFNFELISVWQPSPPVLYKFHATNVEFFISPKIPNFLNLHELFWKPLMGPMAAVCNPFAALNATFNHEPSRPECSLVVAAFPECMASWFYICKFNVLFQPACATLFRPLHTHKKRRRAHF